ncbi:MAG: HAD-IC family P-type ATPase [Candidatus Kerfeldbacteria bacterium]|nr:HAD-IC family P-type ATPase [Candidatus Kerfeldbacteria bacterium]
MDIFRYTIQPVADIIHALRTDGEAGLDEQEVSQRLKQYGRNTLSAHSVQWWRILIRQYASSFMYLLMGAALLAFALQELSDGIIIMLFIFINTTLGFYQEYHSEKTIQLLKKYVAPSATVIRKGVRVRVPTETLVPGDRIVLTTGDQVPADVRFLEINDLTIDETMLTGESVPVQKIANVLPAIATGYHEALNIGFSGTLVVNGEATAVVLTTGDRTVAGGIAHLTNETKHSSNFQRGINRFSRFILQLVGVTLLLIIGAHLFLKNGQVNIVELLLFAITLAVSVIPEALPVVTTFALSRGAKQLAKKNVVVKRLSAVEDMGSIEILCTDKTGTLTENVLTVAGTYPPSHHDVLLYANLAVSDTEKEKHEPFDLAVEKALSAEDRTRLTDYTRRAELPFNPELKRNAVVIEHDHTTELITRGAPEVILALCTRMNGAQKKEVQQWIVNEGRKGHRLLGIAKKKIAADAIDDMEHMHTQFSFVGMISFVDHVKPTTIPAVQRAEALGVRITMITGDSREVAGAVGYEIGLIDSPEHVMTAAEFDALSDQEQQQAVERFSVFARFAPEDKYAIIQLLQKKYEVGFLGEGINDAPGLKAAGVSLVVQSAADIAREAADIILLESSLAVIVDGIQEGRTVFANITKYITGTLSSNFGNFFAVAIASLLIPFLPMLPLQILLVNLLSDFPMIAISTDTVDPAELRAPKKYNVHEIILLATILGCISTIFDFIFFGLFVHQGAGVLQTNWFMGSILTELVFLFSIRTKGFFLLSQRPSRPLLLLTVTAMLTTIILPFTSLGQHTFHFIPPTAVQLGIILSLVCIYFICTECVKVLYHKHRKFVTN